MSTLRPILKPGESALSPQAQRAEEEKNRMRRYLKNPRIN